MNYARIVFYTLAIIGILDMVTQAATSGATKPIRIILHYLFG